jgi:hypothetical protein
MFDDGGVVVCSASCDFWSGTVLVVYVSLGSDVFVVFWISRKISQKPGE